MEVTVHGQEKRFYLAAGEWKPMIGNEITIGKHRFCATPYSENLSSIIIFSEVTSGAKLTEVNLDFFDVMILDKKPKYLQFLEEQALKLTSLLINRKYLDDEVLTMERLAISKFGPKPPTEDIDFNEQ